MSKEAIAEAEKLLKELENEYEDYPIDSNNPGQSYEFIEQLKERIKKQKDKIYQLKKGPAPGAPKGGKSRRRHNKSKKTMKKKSRKHRK